jgi:class 3 adenylate cyclase
MAVHIGARVSAMAQAGEVLVSQTVKDLVVGSGLQFAERGEHELKGVPGEWRLYALGAPAPAPAPLDSADGHMRATDRVVVSLARRAPRAMRLGARLASR